MRITCYKTMLDDDRKNILVKESSGNYPEIRELKSPRKVTERLNRVFQASKQAEEHTYLIATDMKMKIIGVFEVAHGIVDASLLNPREIFVRLCLCGAATFIIAHNHPSGDPSPSKNDEDITQRILDCGKMMGIPMADHIIIGDHTYYSFKESVTI